MGYTKVQDGGMTLVMLGDDVVQMFTSDHLADAWIEQNPAQDMALSIPGDFDESKHPRWPKGTPAGKGGEFMEVAHLIEIVKSNISGSFRFKDPGTNRTIEVRRYMGQPTAFLIGRGGNRGNPHTLHAHDTWNAFRARLDGRGANADAINAGWPDGDVAVVAWLNSGQKQFSSEAVDEAAAEMEKKGFNADVLKEVRALKPRTTNFTPARLEEERKRYKDMKKRGASPSVIEEQRRFILRIQKTLKK